MRIDRLISECGIASRKEASAAARRGGITVNGEVVRDVSRHVDETRDVVTYLGEVVAYAKFTYVMLNKPEGYVSATDDRSLPYVTELLDERLQKMGLFPCGRLDRDTTGLMILTNDGVSAHAMLSPKHHVEKIYAFACDLPLPCDAEEKFASGMTIGDEVCKSASLSCDEGRTSGTVTLTEGKYHQVKRMMQALGSKITRLERISFAGIPLDPTLSRGEWRYCTDDEIKILTSAK